jgi:methylase of polypeptide subunit release factors
MSDHTREQALRLLLKEVAATGYTFVPPTPETHRRVNARPGNEQAHDLRGIFGWSRPFGAATAGQRILNLLSDADALETAGDLFRSRVRIATLNGQVYLHSAFPTTQHDAVFFGPDTYRFVRAMLGRLSQRSFLRVVDIGCGSGAGGLAVAQARYIRELWLADVNPAALALARANASHQERVALTVESDLFAALDGAFDLILANPPYMADADKRAYRDGGGSLGLDLSLRIVREGTSRLSEDGILFLYTGVPIVEGIDPLKNEMEQIALGDGFGIDYGEIDPDVFGEELDQAAYRQVDRIAAVALTVTRSRT